MPAARVFPIVLASLALAPAAMAAQAVATPATPAVPADRNAADAPVRAAVAEFVNALNAFDAERLGRTLSEDVTVFFPGPPFQAARGQGRGAVQDAFARLFTRLRQRGTRNASLQPAGLAVQVYGDTAIATFHLLGQQEVGRRTLVLRREGGRWLVAHMHASVAPMQARPPAAPARPPASPPTPPRR